MNTWAHHFPPASKADWIKQIERDLKGKPLSSLSQEWWPGAALDPIHHADDQPPLVKLPDYLFSQPPVIIENIYAIGWTSAMLNKQLIDALQFGAQQINITIDEPLLTQHGEWLREIYSDMVTWHLESNKLSTASKDNFATIAPDHVFQVVHRKHDIPVDTLLQHAIDEPMKTRWVYSIEQDSNWIDACARTFQLIQSDAKAWKALTGHDDHMLHSELHCEAGADYLQNLIQLRALHVLWQNLASISIASASELISNKYLICEIRPSPGELPDEYLVRATTSATAAFLAGVSGLCIFPMNDDTPNYYRRINRNIHHLLHMESDLTRQSDPMAGAYAIDHYTATWASMIWEKLIGA